MQSGAAGKCYKSTCKLLPPPLRGEFLQESGGARSEVPDSQHLTPPNKSQQRAKDS